MTKQEVFNKVVRHLLTQNEWAMMINEIGVEKCMYLTPTGLKCAVGCLITDNAYHPSLENQSVSADEVQQALLRSGIVLGDNDLSLLRVLQIIHDLKAPYLWRHELCEAAKKYNLELPEELK